MAQREFHFTIIVEPCEEGGFYAECPSLPGCHVQGETYEEVLANIQDAIKLHLQDKIDGNEEISQTKSVSLSTVHITL